MAFLTGFTSGNLEKDPLGIPVGHATFDNMSLDWRVSNICNSWLHFGFSVSLQRSMWVEPSLFDSVVLEVHQSEIPERMDPPK